VGQGQNNNCAKSCQTEVKHWGDGKEKARGRTDREWNEMGKRKSSMQGVRWDWKVENRANRTT